MSAVMSSFLTWTSIELHRLPCAPLSLAITSNDFTPVEMRLVCSMVAPPCRIFCHPDLNIVGMNRNEPALHCHAFPFVQRQRQVMVRLEGRYLAPSCSLTHDVLICSIPKIRTVEPREHMLLESASNISREVKRSVRSMMHSNKL